MQNTTRNGIQLQMEHADDVSSSSRFIWKIENISKLDDESRFSPIFKTGPHKWRLLAFRRGCNMNGYLSIYVVAIECKEWQFAKFILSIVDQANNKNTSKKDTEDMFRFTKDESDWGFDEFIQLKEFKDPSNGYIVNDACIIEVEFCLDSIQDFKEEPVPMELMESVEERNFVKMSIQQCDTHRKLDKKINKQLADKVPVAKFQERSFCIETTASTSTLLANTSGSGSMLHIANGEEVKEDEVSAGPNVIHVHRKCVELTPRLYYVGKTVMNLELTRVSELKYCCCGLKGAALGCFMRSCRNAYHVPCAFDTSGCRWDDEGRLMLCPSHSGAKFSHEKTKKGKFMAKDNSSAIQSTSIDDFLDGLEIMSAKNKDSDICNDIMGDPRGVNFRSSLKEVEVLYKIVVKNNPSAQRHCDNCGFFFCFCV
ncbi:MATH domain and coiled-coil domain-containing protein At3g58360-like isoform X2 [Papaver somniferum]|uniref:MATH domain and coiled-coil domain-containing protein At3g58360-like isoform X2 n=1 Tax=Papaver somniferum TaxID=3469 RepID=UPI000E700804|nr:MATH domain and coiled-coil domain-containing protein At3g58360-like isoform X2 [Papaver somniferum]